MKAERLAIGQIVNPYYSSTAKREAIARGEVYDAPQFLNLPVGEVVDDPDCWKLCLGGTPVMAPADDECRNKVLSAMGSDKRLAFLRNIRRQNHPDVRKQMGKAQTEWIDSMMEVYGKEVEALDGKKPEPRKAPVTPAPAS